MSIRTKLARELYKREVSVRAAEALLADATKARISASKKLDAAVKAAEDARRAFMNDSMA